MLRTHWVTSAAAAKAYFRQTDYYASTQGEWLGKGADVLGLNGIARAEDFDKLCDNIDPRDGSLLRPSAHQDGRIGMDLTFNSTKSVGIARELAGPENAGDLRIEEAHRDAVRYAIELLESDMRTRVRVGGRNDDRVTGNMIAYRVTHRDTRINAEDQKPDMSLHDHVFVMNCTYDAVEGKWKAAQMGQIKHDAPYYEAVYHNRLASNLRGLGYGLRRKDKAFEITGVSLELVTKFSRRRQYIKAVADKLGITSAAGMDKLGATTRLGKAKEMADDLNGYYVSRLSEGERRELGGLIGQRSYVSDDRDAVRYAIGHMFERQSVVDELRLYETALRQGIGSVTPESVKAEAKRQGLLVKGSEATTIDVLAEEQRIIAFAKEGRGRFAPLRRTGLGEPDLTDRAIGDPKLSREQHAICGHVWKSADQVILIRGAAGTGKTRTMRTAIEGIDRPVIVLAPSAEASRDVLRREGFGEADTVARFLIDEKFQQRAKGGVIWVDEAGLLGIRQVREVFDVAERLGARIVLQGDKRQHGSVERGATLRVLEEFAGLPVAELKEIRRQSGRYKQAVASLAKGDMLRGYDTLNDLKWIKQTSPETGSKALVDDYIEALSTKKAKQSNSDRVIVVAPTHIEGDGITAEIRARLKDRKVIGRDGKIVQTLVPLNWTEAERGDLESYDGTEIMQFHRNSGSFRAGDRVPMAKWKPGDRFAKASHFSVYTASSVEVSAGDTIRITANGKTKDGKHKLNNGAVYQVKGFDAKDNIILGNGWVVDKEFGYLTHGYVTTSHAAQGKTVDRVLIAMGNQSLPAINAEQFYVSVSRGRENATIYTDMSPVALRDAIQRSCVRRSAIDLMGQSTPKRKARMWHFMQKARTVAKALRERATDAVQELTKRRERERAR